MQLQGLSPDRDMNEHGLCRSSIDPSKLHSLSWVQDESVKLQNLSRKQRAVCMQAPHLCTQRKPECGLWILDPQFSQFLHFVLKPRRRPGRTGRT